MSKPTYKHPWDSMTREELMSDLHFTKAALLLAVEDALTAGGKPVDEDTVHDSLISIGHRTRAMLQRLSAKPVVHLFLAALLLCGAAHAQTKPVNLALYAADATIRALDVTSTHALLASPCRCFHEDDPLSPNTRKVWPLVSFQAGMSYGAVESGRRLAAHGHPRLGRFLLLADIAGEVWAVQHNYRQHEPAPKASRLTLSPVTVRLR